MREFGKRGKNAPPTPDGRGRNKARANAVAAITRLAQELSEGFDDPDEYNEGYGSDELPGRRRSDYTGGSRDPDQDEVSSLLDAVAELRADIEYMRAEPKPRPNRFAARNRAETEMYGVLEDLNSEITGLNIEQRRAPVRQRAPRPVSKSPEGELADLFADTQEGDIETPNADKEPAPTQSSVRPSADDELNVLQDSKSDVTDVTDVAAELSEEQDPPLAPEPTYEGIVTAASRSTSTDESDPPPVELTDAEITTVEQASSNDAHEAENRLANLIANINSLQVRAQSPSAEPEQEPEPEPEPTRDESESFALLEELQGDIQALASEQAGPIAEAKANAKARQEQEVFALLAKVKADIEDVKSEPKPLPAHREPPRSTAHDELSDRVARLKDIAADRHPHAPDGNAPRPTKKPRVNALAQLSSLCKSLGLKRKTVEDGKPKTETEIKTDEPEVIVDAAPASTPEQDAVEPAPAHDAHRKSAPSIDTHNDEPSARPSIAPPSIALPMPKPAAAPEAISKPSDQELVAKDNTAHEINRFLNPSKKSVATQNAQIREILAEIDVGIARFRACQDDETLGVSEGEIEFRVFDFLVSLRNSVDARLSRKPGPAIIPVVEHVFVEKAASMPDKRNDPEPASCETAIQKSDANVGSNDSGDAEKEANGDQGAHKQVLTEFRKTQNRSNEKG